MKGPLDLAAVRARLAEGGGRRYWRSLEELAETEEFQEFLHREFPRQASEWPDGLSRRTFLSMMGASLALAGLNGCVRPSTEKILPYVQAPEQLIPGVPQYYATAFTMRGYAQGLLVESHMGRPTKVEGNPRHPLNGRRATATSAGESVHNTGFTDAFAQASILGMYDPDRSQVVNHLGRISTWDAFLAELGPALGSLKVRGGAGLRILTGAVTSPTLAAQFQRVLTAMPQAKWVAYEPAGRDQVRAGAKLAFGEEVETQYKFEAAEVIVSLDADFLFSEPGSLRYSREFIAGRRIRKGRTGRGMSRLYVAECTPSITGAAADERMPVRASDVEAVARGLARALAARGVSMQGWEGGAESAGPAEKHKNWIAAAAGDLLAKRGAGLVIAGQEQPPEVHALAHAMNAALTNTGRTVVHSAPVEVSPADGIGNLRSLADEMEAGQVSMLIIIGANPAYSAPADLQFARRMAKVPLRIRLGLYEDETSEQCHWHIPEAHELEMWSDARAFDGTVTILQPLIEPLYDGKSVHDLMSAIEGQPGRPSYDLVRETWQAVWGEADFERKWRRALHDGLVAESASPGSTLSVQASPASAEPPAAARTGLELVFRPDPSVWDGRFTNNGWLQELPRPMTKLTWENAALMSPTTAERLGVRNEDVVELRYQKAVVAAPVWIAPGHADDSVTVHLGYGRRRTGRVGQGSGFDVNVLRTSSALWHGLGLEVVKTGETHPLACTQDHHSMEGRDILRVDDFRAAVQKLEHGGEEPEAGHGGEHSGGHGHGKLPSLYPDFEYKGYAWGMSIDLTACIGCNACVAACVSENNIAVVGKEQVLAAREMHWLRIDRYFEGNLDNPETLFQPMLCQQCEKAPCEVVCPVAATVHSDEGLNDMVYNRCVGTRYCSNNCPYKVRRFNFLQYSDWGTESLKLLRNPDVTVRSRGVMEKCTYCVQRINVARIDAKKGDRSIQDGEIVTACQQACPTDAIVFGDINDKGSLVAKLKAEPLNYSVLEELGTVPRTTYLPRITNSRAEGSAGGAG